jgi:hypothetical protein
MPGLQKTLFVFYHKLFQIAKFLGTETEIMGKGNGLKPELARLFVAINMNVRRFIRFMAVEI